MSLVIVPKQTLDVVTVVDPAISEKVTAARSAVVTVGLDPSERIFILQARAARMNPTQLIEAALEACDTFGTRILGIEGVAYQRALGHFVEKRMAERQRWVPVKMLHPDRRERKEARIRGRLHGFFQGRQVYVEAGAYDFIKEYEEFPLGTTNDILDALAYAPELWQRPEASEQPVLEATLADLAARDPDSAKYWRRFHQSRGTAGLHPEPDLDELDETDQSPWEELLGHMESDR